MTGRLFKKWIASNLKHDILSNEAGKLEIENKAKETSINGPT